MWKASRIASDAADNIQVDGGVFLKGDAFNPADPTNFDDEDILVTVTGSPSITCQPDTEDFFSDVNGAPNNTKQGKRITGWNCSVSASCLDFDEDRLKLYLGAWEATSDGGIRPRAQFAQTDFQSVWALFDKADESGLLAIKIENAVSTGGISFSASKNGKGTEALTLTAHSDATDVSKVPMTFYNLVKVDEDAPEYTYTAVSPVGTENPKNEGWYILSGDRYVLTADTEVDTNKTYYERTEATI